MHRYSSTTYAHIHSYMQSPTHTPIYTLKEHSVWAKLVLSGMSLPLNTAVITVTGRQAPTQVSDPWSSGDHFGGGDMMKRGMLMKMRGVRKTVSPYQEAWRA